MGFGGLKNKCKSEILVRYLMRQNNLKVKPKSKLSIVELTKLCSCTSTITLQNLTIKKIISKDVLSRALNKNVLEILNIH